jgi:hypothetical protein
MPKVGDAFIFLGKLISLLGTDGVVNFSWFGDPKNGLLAKNTVAFSMLLLPEL